MTIDNGHRSIETILQLVYDGREGEALAAIRTKWGADGELCFSTTADAPDAEPDQERPHRVRLANLYRLSVYLMDRELWDQAVNALSWTIQYSVDTGEAFFLEDSRFRKALCRKILGRHAEMLKEKQMISADETFFIGNKVMSVRDLD